MSSPFVAEIRIFACNFAPTGWATCDGQLLPISQNTALFSLLGTFYGGDGKSNFALPNFEGSAAINQGQGAGLTDRFLGEIGGEQFVTLLTTHLPSGTITPMAFQAVTVQGGSLPHNNMSPFLTLMFCIAMQGVFPPRP